jgi:hypothetical protein
MENPLVKIRSGAGTAASKVRGGAKAGWNKTTGGASGAWGKTKGGVTGFGRGTRERAAHLTDATRDKTASLWDRSGGARVVDAARSNSRIAIAWACLALFVIMWIAWTAYIWSTNGATAGLGVLISWPVMFGAVALVVAPFVIVTRLVRRHRDDEGGAAIAGGGDTDGDSMTTGGTYPG